MWGDTIFPTGIPFSLVNNVWGMQYSRGYRIHHDTSSGATSRTSSEEAEAGSALESGSWVEGGASGGSDIALRVARFG